MRNLSFRSILAISLVWCSSFGFAGESSLSPGMSSPEVDLSTPEKALESYWAVKALEQEILSAELAQVRSKRFEATVQRISKVTTGQAKEFFSKPAPELANVYERRIDKVTIETASRAIALATITKVAPIPVGAPESKSLFEERERAMEFKYLLEKEGNDWKVAQAWRLGGKTLKGLLSGYMLFKPGRPPFSFMVWYD